MPRKSHLPGHRTAKDKFADITRSTRLAISAKYLLPVYFLIRNVRVFPFDRSTWSYANIVALRVRDVL